MSITPPKFPKHVIQTFFKEDIEKLIKACVYSREAQTDDRKAFVMRRPSTNRDQAIVLTLLDTGLRATELCSLTVEDVDLKTGKVNIRHGVGGVGQRVEKAAQCSLERALAGLHVAIRPTETDDHFDVFFCKQKVAQIHLDSDNLP